MDDFEAPSFSLGLDDEIHESPVSHAVLPASNPFRVRAPHRNGTFAKAVDTAPLNGTGNTDYDSDFEFSPPNNTERIMRRLKRKSGQPASSPSNPQQEVHHANSISKAKGLSSQNPCKGSNEKKTSLPGKTPTRRTAESNLQTLQNFWKGLNDKTALNFPADSGCKDYTESKAECTGQGFGQTLSMPMEPLSRMSRSQTGASQVCEGTTSDFMANCSALPHLASKAGVCERYAKTPCSEKEGSLSQGYGQRPYGEREDLLEEWGTCKGNTTQSFETCIDVEMHEELATRNSQQSTFKTLDSSGNSLHDQRVGFHQRVATNGKGNVVQTSQKNLDENSNFPDDFSFANSCEKEVPMQSSWRSIDAKTKNSARCERQSLGKSAEGPKMAPKDQLIDSHLECPASVSQSKTSISSSQNKTNALHSFWRSLNEKKSSPCETDIGAEDDDIEICSSDDDFEIGTQSARKLPLCGNATTRKSFAIGNAAADHIFGPSSVLIETSANASSSASQYPPNKNLADAWASPRLTVRSAANTFSASPRTYQSFVVGDALRVSPVHNLDKFQTKPSSFLEKLPEAIPKNIPWPSINRGNDDVFSLPHALNEDRAFNDCAIPTNTSEANANPFGGNSCLSVDPILSNDSKVANLLRIRFPHFTSISALKQGYFIGSEQVYIDYGNQFSGGKTMSCQSGPRVFKQHARQAAPKSSPKWRQAAPKKLKIAMADNDGWIQTGNRNPSRNRAMKSKKGHKGSQVCSQTPVNTDVDSSVGAGHWVTERTGKRIYITKDGRKLSGSSAYNQHIKDSGKRSKKTKRRRPRNKQ